jgi:hypothetical protein
VRFTLRQMITAVAVAALLFWLYTITPPLGELLDDTFYPAMNSITKAWDAGPASKIDVDLKSRYGSIRIKGNNLLIKAKADGGGVEYTGRLASGFHSFATGSFAEHADEDGRHARGIRFVLPPDMAFKVDAVSARDQVKSAFPLTSEPPRKPGVLTGTVGAEPKVRMDLRSDDGTIEILTSTSSVSD